MALFKNFADVTAADKRFTEIVEKIKETVKDYFYTYTGDLGIVSSPLSDYLCGYGDLYEDANEDLHIIYPVSKSMAKNFTAWLENYDIVCVDNNRCSASQSNDTAAAELLNQLLDMAK